MNPNLQTAILEFLGNDFHLDPQKITPDLNFQADLHLNPDQLSELLQHMQDALNFTIPEEKIDSITSIADLFAAIAQSEEETLPYDNSSD
jgi:acyl carrier protein